MKKGFSDDTFLARWLAGQLKEDEQKSFEEREDYRDFNQIAEGVKELNIPIFSEEQSWKKLLAKKQINQARQITKKMAWRTYSIAASIAIIIGTGIAIYLGQQTTSTANSQKLVIHLPDASEVQLNANSTIYYNSFLWRFGRKLTMEGEAFFDVKKGKTFDVNTASGKVSVLGTSFNVWARDQQLEVDCHTGKVKVKSFNTTETIQAGENIIASAGKMQRGNIASLTNVPSWTNGISKFDAAPVKRILEELERQFNTDIEYRGDLQKELNFSFPHNDLDAALRLLSGALQASYEIDANNKVIIKPNQ